jgi:SAM-dependent methyltransferase
MPEWTEAVPLPPLEAAVDDLYRHRIPATLHARRNAVWQVLCRCWLGRYIPPEATVLEVGAGYCEFINHIEAAERLAVDLNPATRDHAAAGVIVHELAAERLGERIPPGSCDVVLMSNFLEHCRSRDQMLAVLRASGVALRPGGRLLILGPNFRCCYRDYFDYFDHHLPLTDKAVVEALHLAGFDVETVLPRTLPFTFRGRLPSWPWLVRLYLRLPWIWPLFGAQFFLVCRKPGQAQHLTLPAGRAA